MILAMEVSDILAGAAKRSRERAAIANYILGHSLHCDNVRGRFDFQSLRVQGRTIGYQKVESINA